jgi:hypothetical protein
MGGTIFPKEGVKVKTKAENSEKKNSENKNNRI